MNNTLVNGLEILEYLSSVRAGRGVSEIALALGFGKSTVHRTLRGLVEAGYVWQDAERGDYHLTLKLFKIGSAALCQAQLRQAAAAVMEDLRAATRETVHLSVLDGDDVVYLHKLDGVEPVRAYSMVGGRAPACCVATGKALLAFDAPVRPVRPSAVRHTPMTITGMAEFAAELERIRGTGYAINRGEWRERIWGVAAPIRDDLGRVVAAVGVSGPEPGIRGGPIAALGCSVQAAAHQIACRLVAPLMGP